MAIVDIEVMSKWIHRLALAATMVQPLAPGFAQEPSSPVPTVDSALLAKANGGDAVAEVAIGELYAAGTSAVRTDRQLAEDYKRAAEWYRKAAERGDPAGETHLAALYRDGKGVARDMVLAAEWYRKAAEQGDAAAQGILGVLYSFGQGVQQSYVEAYFWLDLAASVPGPEQAHYAANRQLAGAHITADELAIVEDRVEKWQAAHPRTKASK